MNNVKRVNAFLWTANVLLIVGIVAFAFQFLILQEVRPIEVDPPLSLAQSPPDKGMMVDPKFLRELPNPVKAPVDRTKDPVRTGPVRLIGTDRVVGEPGSDTAYIVLVNRNLFLNAYVGEAIRDRSTEEDVPELKGWKLQKVTPTEAIFETPGDTITLKLDEYAAAPAAPGNPGGTSGPPGPPAPPSAWERARYASRKLEAGSNENMETWQVDRKEVEWAAANWESALNGVSLEPYSGGGLKITALPQGSFASDRGFKAGDVIRSVNNQKIDSLVNLTDLVKGMAKNTPSMTVTVDRGGRPYTLTFQAAASSRTR